MAIGRLDQHERYRIHSLREIAQTLVRAPSTISRELRRNASGGHYEPQRAQRLSQRRRTHASRRPRVMPQAIASIEQCLRQDWSPEQIAGSTGLASHEWIYGHIYADQRRGGTLYQGLRRPRRRRRKRRLRNGRGQLTGRRSWRERPDVVESRARTGDWEIDTMHAASGTAVVVTMTERGSGLQLLACSPDCTAGNVMRAIVQRLGRFRHMVYTLTADNGKEFAEHRLLAAALQAEVYFADPYSPWQCGSNENANGLVRQYLPRSLDFATITPAQLRHIEQRLNTRPRKRHRYKTPLGIFVEGFNHAVANRS
ncbi:IS30 family transposase [Klebsiella variicola]